MPWINSEHETRCGDCGTGVKEQSVVWADFDTDEVYCGGCGESARVRAEKTGTTVHDVGCTCGFCKMGYTPI